MKTNIFTTIRTEGALLPADLLQRIVDGKVDGLTPESYHYSGERLNEIINRAWNTLQGAWSNFKSAQEMLPKSDPGTTITRERWLLPLFRELDYGRLPTAPAVEIDGRSYPISHGWGNVPIHLVGVNVDLDRRSPGVTGAATASPHSLLQIYLNRSSDNLWGFVSNGHKLRILRDNATLTRQAYVEFDLQAMMEGEVYSDFVLLWLLCHQSRVEGDKPADCWLERWMKNAEQQGTRALDQLRDGVEQAITALGLGFIEHPSNTALRDVLTNGTLDKQDYYRQLLRIVYRLLFLFTAEDRELLLDPQADETARERYLKFYSTARLRRIAERLKGTRHADLWESLRLVMNLLSGENSPRLKGEGLGVRMGLVPLGSYLFRPDAVRDVINCHLSNQHLLDAIRALSLTYDDQARVYRTVDYRNLGPEELGSIYESLLELHPIINIPARGFALATAGGNERKTTGSYYTPTSLINALLDSALDPVLNEALNPHQPPPRAGEATEQRILALKICDPACGSGHFLIAAAHRIAKALAFVRTGEEEPTPAAIQEAKRDVIGHCIYGVDINPMAVELCKVNLWMEALEPGKPLSFLDHRILVGNSLLGTTPRLMANGIPDEAFNPIEGDDKAVVSSAKKQNRKERQARETGQRSMFEIIAPPADYHHLAAEVRGLEALDDDTLTGIQQKEQRYRELANDPEYQKARGLADAWCAAFVWHKTDSPLQTVGEGQGVRLLPMTDLTYQLLTRQPFDDRFEDMRAYTARLADQYQFFHWHVAFPDVFSVPDDLTTAENEQTGWNGGFDCVLGNPPWDQVQLDDREFFAISAPEIAAANTMATRKKLIKELEEKSPELYKEYLDAIRLTEGIQHFIHASNRYPLTSYGRLNTSSLFAEAVRLIQSPFSKVGLILPSGIATDSFNQFFFQDLMRQKALESLLSFFEIRLMFIDTDSRNPFCLFTLTGSNQPASEGASFVFFARSMDEIKDADRRFMLTASDILLLNPNTQTCPVFQSRRDAELTKKIYSSIPILANEPEQYDPWGANFKLMYMMNTDSYLFLEANNLLAYSSQLIGNIYLKNNEMYLPLYEGKMLYQFDHRFGTYEGTTIRDMSYSEKRHSDHYPTPRYWVSQQNVEERLIDWNYEWLVGYRGITNTASERSNIFAILPRIAMGNSAPVLPLNNAEAETVIAFVSNMNSFVLDYVSRQKIGGNNLNVFIVKQFAVLPPHTYTPTLLDFIVPRVLELSYTAWDLQPFAQDVGYNGAPFIWDEERRFVMRCELDALYFHLYHIAREDVDYIMDTFPIVRRKDESAYGEYRTKRVILEMYDQMAQLPKIEVPAPKSPPPLAGEGLGVGAYAVPDVAQFVTWLTPPPADPGVAHQNTR